jgi:cytochrome c biogenesis protein CcdA
MLLIAFLGGVLTLFSPCILPVIPLLLSSTRGNVRTTLLTLLGLASGFATLASLAAVSANWVIEASVWGRYLALAILTLSALALLSARVSACLSRPWLWLGARLQGDARRLPPALSAWLLGVASGLLWAPCAGPILGLILSGAMLEGPSANTTLLLFSFGLGSAVALAILILLGRVALRRLRPSLRLIEWLRRGTGAVALLAIIGIASGLNAQLANPAMSGLLSTLERRVLEVVPRVFEGLVGSARAAVPVHLPDLGLAPELSGVTQWLNSAPLDWTQLRGKVVLLEWAQRYAEQGLVVVGVHTPEYPHERIVANVRQAIKQLGIRHPVAIDNQYQVWSAFGNQYWPAHYFIDAEGHIRHAHMGEGDYAEQERVIQELLRMKDMRAGADGAAG